MSATAHNAANAANASNPLRRWRQQHHVTQARLAFELDVHPSVVSQWEKGHAVPSLKKFHELNRHTGIAVHTLLRFFVPLAPVLVAAGVAIPFALFNIGVGKV